MMLFAGVAVQTSSTRSIRQNELDASLSNALQSSMQVLAVNNAYDIADTNQLKADILQNILANTTSEGTYKIKIYEADAEKGLIDCEVVETIAQVIGTGTVAARKTVVLEQYINENNEYFKVKFLDSDEIPVKEVEIHGGDYLITKLLPVHIPEVEGKTFQGWQLLDAGGMSTIYTADNISQMIVTSDVTFQAVYQKRRI